MYKSQSYLPAIDGFWQPIQSTCWKARASERARLISRKTGTIVEKNPREVREMVSLRLTSGVFTVATAGTAPSFYRRSTPPSFRVINQRMPWYSVCLSNGESVERGRSGQHTFVSSFSIYGFIRRHVT